jgi:uncharacterized metal-binding protein YceD (DUF177 family)
VEVEQIYDKFKIRIAGIADGNCRFSIDCNKTFFELSKLLMLHDGIVHVRIEMEKLDKMLNLAFHFEGKVIADCDRCLAPVTLKIEFDTNLIVKLVAHPNEDECKVNEDDEIWLVDENSYELDLFHYIYESLLLILPQKIVHPDDKDGHSTCNPEMLEKLAQCSPAHHQEIDPRWEPLKNLKLN